MKTFTIRELFNDQPNRGDTAYVLALESNERIKVLEDALKSISTYTEELNSKALNDAKFATILWRGCVAEATAALEVK